MGPLRFLCLCPFWNTQLPETMMSWTIWSRVSGSRRSSSLVCWFGHSCCLETLWTRRHRVRHTPPGADAHPAHMWHYTGTHTYKRHKHMDTKNQTKTLWCKQLFFTAWNRTFSLQCRAENHCRHDYGVICCKILCNTTCCLWASLTLESLKN